MEISWSHRCNSLVQVSTIMVPKCPGNETEPRRCHRAMVLFSCQVTSTCCCAWDVQIRLGRLRTFSGQARGDAKQRSCHQFDQALILPRRPPEVRLWARTCLAVGGRFNQAMIIQARVDYLLGKCTKKSSKRASSRSFTFCRAVHWALRTNGYRTEAAPIVALMSCLVE